MKWIIQPPCPAERALLGGKAAALAQLENFPVPEWFVITPTAFHASVQSQTAPDAALDDVCVAPEVAAEISTALAASNHARFAVRSSAVEEDGASFSFAGQLESFLDVAPQEVPQRVADVWRSGFSPRLRAYLREHSVDASPQPPAVLVQRMVPAQFAGVAFSADPVSGRRGLAVVSAVRGLGDKLVSGETDADTFHVNRSGEIVHRTEAMQPLLRDEQIRAIAALARRAEQHFQRPQDIEWAIDADEKLWLLQSRPITTLGALADPEGELRLWDNSNIAESYGGITTPLTYSFARRGYEGVYREFCRLMRVPESTIEANADTFRCMIGLVRGRVFYNLANWHRMLAMLPGYATNRRFMEQMMGVKESLPPEIDVAPLRAHQPSRFRDLLNLTGTIAGLVWNHLTIERQIRAFYARLNRALAEPAVPLSLMRSDELAKHYGELESQLLTRWDAPLVNDFFAMIFHGVLRKLCARRYGNEALANEWIRDSGEIISAEPARRMKQLAALAAVDSLLLEALQSGSPAEVRRTAPAQFTQKLDDYLARFGDRCLDELKLESATLCDDCTPLLHSIAALAARGEQSVPAPEAARPEPRGLTIRWVLRHARARVRGRENLRFERTRLFGRVRRIFVEFGRRLHADGHLEEARDIFHLEVNEVLGFIDGTATTTDLKSLVSLRRAEYERFAAMPPPADRFETRGAVHQGNTFQSRVATTTATEEHGDTRTGLPCCAGIVRGRVRVITHPRGATIEAGEILVAERTDPGWIFLFPAASAVLVERGSLLSHAAIVSRELGLPSVVSIPGLTSWLHTGDIVEMNGGTGVIRRVSADA